MYPDPWTFDPLGDGKPPEYPKGFVNWYIAICIALVAFAVFFLN